MEIMFKKEERERERVRKKKKPPKLKKLRNASICNSFDLISFLCFLLY